MGPNLVADLEEVLPTLPVFACVCLCSFVGMDEGASLHSSVPHSSWLKPPFPLAFVGRRVRLRPCHLDAFRFMYDAEARGSAHRRPEVATLAELPVIVGPNVRAKGAPAA
jgi:hypothetical protein